MIRDCIIIIALGAFALGCGSKTGKTSSRLPDGSDPVYESLPTAPGARPAPSSPAGPASRLQPNAPGVEVGLRLLRREISAQDAASAWQAEGLSPEQALDVVGRLPLTAGPTSDHTAQIVDAFGRQTEVHVFVPSGPAPARGYQVLLFLHGLGGNGGHASGLRAMAPNALVVAPTAQQPPANAIYDDNGGGAGAGGVVGSIAAQVMQQLTGAFGHWWVYQDEGFVLRALDYVRERYAVDSNRILIGGVSMGGFGASNVGLRFHDRFAGMVSVVGGISRFEYTGTRDERTRSLFDNSANLPVFLLHGDQDSVVPVQFSRWSAQDLAARGADHVYREVPGADHDPNTFPNVPALLGELDQWGRDKIRNPSPARVVHRALGTYHPGAYWVRVDGMQGSSARITAQVSSRTAIDVTRENVTALTLFLDPALVDVDGPITITIDGQVVGSPTVAPSLNAVAESFARTRDPQLTYSRMVTLR